MPIEIMPSDKEKEKLDAAQVTERECAELAKYLGACRPTAFLLDLLRIIIKVLDTGKPLHHSFFTVNQHLCLDNKVHVDKVKASLLKHHIRDIILANIYYARIKRETADHSSRRRLTTLQERALAKEEMDILLYHCLQVARVLVFENRPDEKFLKSSGVKLDEESLRKANTLLADFLFGATVNLTNDKDGSRAVYLNYLKLYNHCLKEIEPMTFNALMETILQVRQTEKQEKNFLLRKDSRTIGLVFEKFINRQINLGDRKKFLNELYTVLRSPFNLKIFFTVPNYLNLLHDLLNLDPNDENSDSDIRATVQKILRKFIYHILFLAEQNRVFDLIALIEFDTYLNSRSNKPSEQAPRREDIIMIDNEQKMPSNNFFKLLKPIEFTLKEYKEQALKKHWQEESKNESATLLDKSTEVTSSSKKPIIANVTLFVYYYEHFLQKLGRNIEQEEVQILQFTNVLFEFLHFTQILHVTHPPMKPVLELNSTNLFKRFEGICHRNGGPLISMLTILFTVLKYSKILNEKIGLLKCCSIILGLNRGRKNTEELQADSPIKRKGTSKEISLAYNPLRELIADSAKLYPVQEIKKDLSVSLFDPPNADRLPDLLLQKVNLFFLFSPGSNVIFNNYDRIYYWYTNFVFIGCLSSFSVNINKFPS